MSKTFYKTTQLNDFELAEAIANATRQEDAIMLLMQNRAPQEFTAYSLQKHFHKWPITSIRRALFNLESKGLIIRTGEVVGEMGMRIGSYRVASPSEMKTEPDDDHLIPESLAAKRIGTQILKKWIVEKKIPFEGKRPKKFRQKDLNKAIMSEFMNNKGSKIESDES